MSNSIREARRALGKGETGEALVHLWNALEQARADGDPKQLAAIGGLATEVAERGDEGEQAEAARLVEELTGEAVAAAPADEHEQWILPGAGTPEPVPPPDVPTAPAEVEAETDAEEGEPQKRRGAGLGWLIPIAIFIFLTLRDAFS